MICGAFKAGFINLFFLFSNFCCLFSTSSTAKVSLLHKKISDDLIFIRKKYPDSQRQVYSVLDQVGRMYKISKGAIEKKALLKASLKENANKLIKLAEENSSLKKEVFNLKENLSSRDLELEKTSKKLSKNNVLLSFATKERKKLSEEVEKLKLEIFNTEDSKGNQSVSPDKAEKNQTDTQTYASNSTDEFQSLNISSTCAPISPA